MRSEASVHGIHHVTAIAGHPQENLTFYAGVLGMRLVKRSVNQDDPGTYHLFYADAAGTPGTDVTFWPGTSHGPVPPGGGHGRGDRAGDPCGEPRVVAGQARRAATSSTWKIQQRFGERVLPFRDPHGLALALVEIEEDREFAVWEVSAVPAKYQIRGVHAVRIQERVYTRRRSLCSRESWAFAASPATALWHRWSAGLGVGGVR